MKKKILFCHIPKCCGTNINYNLSKKFNDNYTWYIHNILKYDIETYNDYYKFAIIRDPIHKLISLYFYHIEVIEWLIRIKKLEDYQEGNWEKIFKLYEKYKIVDIYSFLNKYKILYNNEIKPNISNLEQINKTTNMCYNYLVGFLPQYLFICDDNYNILVDDAININDMDIFLKNKFDINNETKLNTHKNSNDNYNKYINDLNLNDINDIKDIYKEDYIYLIKNN
jgi:hypothetical protein